MAEWKEIQISSFLKERGKGLNNLDSKPIEFDVFRIAIRQVQTIIAHSGIPRLPSVKERKP